MCFIAIPQRTICEFIRRPKVLKFANKTCHKIMGQGIKDTIKLYEEMGIIDIEKIKNCYSKINTYV